MAGNNKIKLHERLAKLEESQIYQEKKLDCIEKKLDSVRLTIENWRGRFGLISAIIGLLSGGVVSLILKIIIK